MKTIAASIRNTACVLGAMWFGFLLQQLSFFPTTNWGILPRHLQNLKGILTAPLMHAGWAHLLSNSLPMVVLCLMLFQFYRRIAWVSLGLIHLWTGVAVWLLARGGSVHLGASGVVYGLAAFVFCNGLFRRNFQSILLLLVVTVLYSGLLYGVVPVRSGISWESHLFGALVGAVTAFGLRGMKTSAPRTSETLPETLPDAVKMRPQLISNRNPDNSEAFEQALKRELESPPPRTTRKDRPQ